jgi:hypothetical protein
MLLVNTTRNAGLGQLVPRSSEVLPITGRPDRLGHFGGTMLHVVLTQERTSFDPEAHMGPAGLAACRT